MADTTTELEVLNQIVDVLGGQSGQYETVVPTLQQILALLGGGGGGSGYNPSLSVGRADALTGADSTAQWATRESTGSGAATVRSVQGAAIGWNQLYTNDAVSKTQNGTTFTNNGDGSWTIEETPTATTRYQITTLANGIPAGHKMLLSMHASRASDYVLLFVSYGGSNAKYISATQNAAIIDASVNVNADQLSIRVIDTFDGQTITITPQCFDLTAMFGSGNEPATVEEFERMYPASYYPYSAPTLKPVQIAGIRSTDAQGGELDSVEWPTQTLRAAGNVRDMLYSDHVDMKVGVLVLTGNEDVLPYSYSTDSGFFLNAVLPESGLRKAYSSSDFGSLNSGQGTSGMDKYAWLGVNNNSAYLLWADCPYATVADFKAWLEQRYVAGNPVTFFYELATPTTTPISPALPMTYRVEQGGIESIIVPDGEISAAPLITLADGESAADVVMDALACIATPDGPTATANHSVGTYLTMGGKLYKVTSAIAVGESIAAGTNVTQTTVMAELVARTA